jgi:hypothetical protein
VVKIYRFISTKRKSCVRPEFGSIFRAESKDDDDTDPFDMALSPGKISGFGRTMTMMNAKDGSPQGKTKASLFAVTARDGVDRKGGCVVKSLF